MNNYSQRPAPHKLRAGVVGYTGYSGAELVRLLDAHPAVDLLLLDHRKADEGGVAASPIPCRDSPAAAPAHAAWEPIAVSNNKLDVVFTATPPEISQELVPAILG